MQSSVAQCDDDANAGEQAEPVHTVAPQECPLRLTLIVDVSAPQLGEVSLLVSTSQLADALRAFLEESLDDVAELSVAISITGRAGDEGGRGLSLRSLGAFFSDCDGGAAEGQCDCGCACEGDVAKLRIFTIPFLVRVGERERCGNPVRFQGTSVG